MSCVVSDKYQGLGSCQTLVVSMRLSLVLGNANLLSRKQLWASLLSHYREEGMLVEGQLSNLKMCSISIPRPNRAHSFQCS